MEYKRCDRVQFLIVNFHSITFNLWKKRPWKIECFMEDLFLGG